MIDQREKFVTQIHIEEGTDLMCRTFGTRYLDLINFPVSLVDGKLFVRITGVSNRNAGRAFLSSINEQREHILGDEIDREGSEEYWETNHGAIREPFPDITRPAIWAEVTDIAQLNIGERNV